MHAERIETIAANYSKILSLKALVKRVDWRCEPGLTLPEGMLGAGIWALASRLPAKEVVQHVHHPESKNDLMVLDRNYQAKPLCYMVDQVVPLVVGTTNTAEFLRDVVGTEGGTRGRLS